MPAIHIYNPDTDYALGYTGRSYSPPASILRLRREGALFPATYARKNDMIIVLDKFDNYELAASPYYSVVKDKGIDIVNIHSGLEAVFDRLLIAQATDPIEILPWGWNLTLRNLLLKYGVPASVLKTEEEIENIRSLSHRKTVIPFQTEMSLLLPDLNIKRAVEFFNENDAWVFASDNPMTYFKMPWSSSGRGVVCRKNMTDLKFSEWIHGAIKRQGSVMGEYGYDRKIDFASEWICSKGEVSFIGLSLFATSSNGTYIGNQSLSQENIFNILMQNSHFWGWNIIESQRKVIESLIAPLYDGPLGIDMLIDNDGNINPCVEINVRMTMGMATILKNL